MSGERSLNMGIKYIMEEEITNQSNSVLAKVGIQSLDPSVLKPLIESVKQAEGETVTHAELQQSHRFIEGSLDEKISKINEAVYSYLRNRRYDDADEWNEYAYILGIRENDVILCAYAGWDGYEYYSLPYTYANGEVQFGDALIAVNVKMVVEVLSTDLSESIAELPTPVVEAAEVVSVPVAEVTPVAQSEAVVTPLNETLAANAQETVEQCIQRRFGADAEKHLLRSVVQATLKQSATETGPEGLEVVRVQGIATVCDILNANGFVYPKSVWQSNLEQMNRWATEGRFTGKVEHPETDLGLQDVAIKFEPKFEFDGDSNVLLFEAVVLPTDPYGKNLQTLLKAGVNIDISSRGYGSVKQSKWNGQDALVIQNDFTCIAFDAVSNGAAFGSRVTEFEVEELQSTQPEGAEVALEQSTTEKQNVALDNLQQTTEITMEDEIKTEAPAPVVQSATDRAAALRQKHEFVETRRALLAQAAESYTDAGVTALQTALNSVAEGDLPALLAQHDAAQPFLSPFAKTAVAPAASKTQNAEFGGVWIKKTSAELAPKTEGEMIQRLTELVDDKPLCQGGGAEGNKFSSTRKALGAILTNMAGVRTESFNGKAALRGLMLLEAGNTEAAGKVLNQSFDSDAVIANNNADPGGAPLSAALIFPLVTRVFPKLILNEIAGIQPIDRPDGKIFYLDHLRSDDKRVDLNTSDNPFNSSFADNDTEGSAVARVKFKLTGDSVRADTKKLAGQFSIEEMQDLRAYHGLDAAGLLMEGMAMEIAIERNAEVLNGMLAGASAGALTFGTTKATGWSQKDWDEYIWVYLSKLENQVFAKRNGNITHLIVGMDAALTLSKSLRGGFTIGGEFSSGKDDGDGRMDGPYPGTTYYGSINAPNGSRYRVFKTNFWASGTANGSKILGIRKGTQFGDVPYIWAPYNYYITPSLIDPEDFSIKQGVMERSAQKLVVGDAMATISVSATTGVEL